MADSVRRLIIENLVTLIEGLTVANGYHYGWTNCFTRGRPSAGDIPGPFCNLITGRESYETIACPKWVRSLPIRLVAIHRAFEENDDEGEEVAENMLADLEKALVVDITRGGNATDTLLIANQLSTPLAVTPEVGCELEIEILYGTALGDPTTKR